MTLAFNAPATISAVGRASGGLAPIDWLLWGGLAAALATLYIGIYVWMRRPKFGEGDGDSTDDATTAACDPPALDEHEHANVAPENRARPGETAPADHP